MIFLAPEGCLCNRLRTMESGLRLARTCGSKIVVFWVRHDFAMRQYFGELFQPISGGSFGSSFSVVAAQIGGCPPEILKTDSTTCENDERFNWKYAKQDRHA